MPYANKTSVSEGRSRQEIESLLMRRGADKFGYMRQKESASVAFELDGFSYQVAVPLPNYDEFVYTPKGRKRTTSSAQKEYEAEIRRRWRSLTLWLKAMIVAEEDNVVALKETLLPFIVMPDGKPFHSYALPEITRAIENGSMPKLLNSH